MFSTLYQIASALKLSTKGLKNVDIKAISSDSRTISTGELFIALGGDNFNGHDYIKQAEAKGAVAIITCEPISSVLPTLIVVDTKFAFGQIASWARQYYKPKVLAITGSNGKTSVKNMLDAIMSEKGTTLSTKGNFNNKLGVSMTLCALRKQHRYLVVELGASQVGEIKYLAYLVKPDVAVITNAGDAHIGEFGSLKNLVTEKGQIYKALTIEGIAVLNKQSLYYNNWKELLSGQKIVDFGAGTSIFASNIDHHNKGVNFVLNYQCQKQLVKLNFLGQHQVDNALAAAACAISQDIPLELIAKGLALAKPEIGRLNLYQLKYWQVIDDSYNANPTSMRAAIDVLTQFNIDKVLVLGAMAELGDGSEFAHLAVIKYAQSKGITIIYTLGEEAKAYQISKHFDNVNTLVKTLYKNHQNSAILIKGSRFSKMERVLAMMKKY